MTSDAPETSFDGFFAEAWPEAFRLACFFTQDTSVGEEVAQEVMVRLFRRWDGTPPTMGYVRTALLNESKNRLRHADVRRRRLPLAAGPAAVDLAADELADALAALPFRQRAVVVLRYYASLSEAEIAETLGCRPGTVKSLSSRALSRLAKELPR